MDDSQRINLLGLMGAGGAARAGIAKSNRVRDLDAAVDQAVGGQEPPPPDLGQQGMVPPGAGMPPPGMGAGGPPPGAGGPPPGMGAPPQGQPMPPQGPAMSPELAALHQRTLIQKLRSLFTGH